MCKCWSMYLIMGQVRVRDRVQRTALREWGPPSSSYNRRQSLPGRSEVWQGGAFPDKFVQITEPEGTLGDSWRSTQSTFGDLTSFFFLDFFLTGAIVPHQWFNSGIVLLISSMWDWGTYFTFLCLPGRLYGKTKMSLSAGSVAEKNNH